jgi:two-component system nitrate/nitrite response regulator NarL
LIVDDSASFRAVARALLEEGGFSVVGEAATAAEGLAAARRLRPDCVLLDVQLPDGDGFAIATLLAEGDDRPAVVLISSRDLNDLEPLLEQTPVRGFLAKERLSALTLAELLR